MKRPMKVLSPVTQLICPPPYLLKASERRPFSAQDKFHAEPVAGSFNFVLTVWWVVSGSTCCPNQDSCSYSRLF